MTSTGSSSIIPTNSSGSEELQVMTMDQRTRKRRLSNRESARRSRMKKKKNLDDLIENVNRLKKDNAQMQTTLKATSQQYLAVDAENSVLITQMMELSTRLQSLNEILDCMNGKSGSHSNYNNNGYACEPYQQQPFDNSNFMDPWNLVSVNQNIMTSADMFLC